MMHTLKAKLYFTVARYFSFWAGIKLRRWKPKIIAVTGSSGKTTTMHLLRSQIGDMACYSDKANSSFGIPFDILGMGRQTLYKTEWLGLFFKAPFAAFKKVRSEKIYVAEVDCDRPNEGAFLAKLLKPAITIWLSSTETHSQNFEKLVTADTFPSTEQAIAYEFGNIAAATSETLIVNYDSKVIVDQLRRSNAKNVCKLQLSDCTAYTIDKNGSTFKSKNITYKLPYLVPKPVFYSLEAVKYVSDLLGTTFDSSFKKLSLPPSRSSLLQGIKSTTIIDSSYNSSHDALATMIELFDEFPAKNKWAVIGDILEQGSKEKSVHEWIADTLKDKNYKKIILMGPRVSKYTAPLLRKTMSDDQLVVFERPAEALDYIKHNLSGQETILFKGARFLEGIIEHLLANKSDANKLCRREAIWQKRRKTWGL